MSSIETIEIDGELVGILSADAGSRTFQFHSGIAPYDLLDGSRFARPVDAHLAARKIHSAGRTFRRPVKQSTEMTHVLAA